MTYWVDEVVAEAKSRRDPVDRIEPLVSEGLRKLRSVIERDADKLNTELYQGEDIFVVEDAPVHFYDFRVKMSSGRYDAQIRMRSEELALTYTVNPGRSIELGLIADKTGGISFYQGNQIVSYDEVSRRLLEPPVRGEFHRAHDASQVSLDKRNRRTLYSNVSARPHRDANLGLGQRRRIINSIASRQASGHPVNT